MTFLSNEKALTNHCLLLIGIGEEERCWHSLLTLRFFIPFFWVRVCVSKCVYICVSCPKAWLSSGVWHHTTNTAVYDQRDDEICFTLSVCTRLPASFFSSPNWPWLRRGIVLAKMWKGYAWLRTSRFSNLLSTAGRGEKCPPRLPNPLTLFSNLQYFFLNIFIATGLSWTFKT